MNKDKNNTTSTLYDISGKIKLLRTNKNISQEQLGELIGVSKRTVSGYENDICFPSIEVLVRLSKVFQVSTDELLGIDNSKFEEIDYNKLVGNIVNISSLSRKDQNRILDLVDRLSSDKEWIY